MTLMAKTIFWASCGVVFYVYFGYPLLLCVWRRFARKPVLQGLRRPGLSIVIAARNEAASIAAKIQNSLELDYPREKLEIIVSLDGPTDGTAEIAREYEGGPVRVIWSRLHQGKAAALNRAVASARNEIIVFCDARQRIHRRAMLELAADLGDPAVGGVSGELLLAGEEGDAETDAVHPMGFYWRYEKWLRGMESDIHSTAGATGALYAIRRELFRPLPADAILDDVFTPLGIVLAGKRVIFEPAARAYDHVACCPQAEFRRKVRTLAGNYQLLARMPVLLLPWRNPIFLQFVSHKLGRLLVPYFLAALFVSNCFLLGGLYWIPLVLQFIWYAMALGGGLGLGSGRMGVPEPAVLERTREAL